MKWCLVLFGCLLFVSSVYSWAITGVHRKMISCPPDNRGCLIYSNVFDDQARKILCLSGIVAEVSFSEGGCDKIRFNKMHRGNKSLDGTELTLMAHNYDCAQLQQSDKLCMLVHQLELSEQTNTLDNNAFLIGAQCEFPLVKRCNDLFVFPNKSSNKSTGK